MNCRWCKETSVGYCWKHLQEHMRRQEVIKFWLLAAASVLAGFGVVSKLLGMP